MTVNWEQIAAEATMRSFESLGPERTRASFAALTGSDRAYEAWQAFYARTGRADILDKAGR